MNGSLQWVAGKHTPTKTYITRVLNFGTWDEWRTLTKNFSREEIKNAVDHPLRGHWTRRGKAFAETRFNCRMPDEVLISLNV